MIYYIIGDATYPQIEDGLRVIAHVCNDIGKWGAGFSGAISKRWKGPEEYFKKQYKWAKPRPKLGDVQWNFPELDIGVVNMIAQHGVRSLLEPTPIRYDALERCLEATAEGARACAGIEELNRQRLTFHMPRIGCGLAGGDWERVEPLIDEVLWDIDVYVYDLP